MNQGGFLSLSYLNRIIAIDNISRGQFVDIPANEHTNFNGVIRAGKTTTLRAALLFYGTRPGDIAKAKGDAFEGFATFYFPNPSSYIVYEYVKDDKTYCVVCTGKQNQVQYQFLDTAYEQKFFLHEVDGKTMIATQSQFKVAIEVRGFELTSRVGADTYAKIIQSSKPYREKGGNADIVRKYRPKYALPSHGYSIDNIDRVLSNIFASKASVANIRSALTNILVQESAIDSGELKLDENAGHISVWFDKREAWLDVDNRRDMVKQLSETAFSYKACMQKLSGLLARTHKLRDETKDEIKQRELTDRQDNAKHSEIARERNLHAEKTGATSVQLQSELKTLENEVDELEAIKRDFVEGLTDGSKTEKPIQELIILHNSLVTKEKAEKDAKSFYEDVSSGQLDILAKYDQLRSGIEQINYRNETDASNLRNKQLELRQELIDQQQQSHESKKAAADHLWSQRLDQASRTISSLSNTSAMLNAQYDNISILSSYADSIAACQQELDESKQHEIEARDELSGFKDQLSHQRLLRSTLTSERVNCQELENRDIQARDELKSRIGDDTLFDFLTANIEGFEQTIGKVISPSLLSLKNLDPKITSQTNSIYGVELDLTAIEEQAFNSVDSITTRVIALDESIAEQEQKRELLESKLEVCSEEIRTLERDVARAKFDQKHAEGISKETVIELEKTKDQAKLDLETRRELLDEQKRAIQSELNSSIQNKTSIERDRQQALADLDSQHKIAKMNIAEKHEFDIANIEKDLAKKIEEQNQQLINLNKQEKIDVEARGFSAETLENARLALKSAEKSHALARYAGERVSRYNRFIKDKWSGHAELVNNVQNKSSELSSHKEETEQTQLLFSNQLVELESKIINSKNKLDTLHQALSSVNDLIYKFTELELKPDEQFIHHFRSVDVSEASVKMNTLSKECEDVKTIGQSYFNEIKRTFQRKLGTPTFEYYERLLAEQSSLHPSADLWWSCSDSLTEYLDGDHLSQANLLRSDYQLVAQSITEFSEQISSTHRELNLLGKRLTASMKGIAEHFEAIGDLDLSVSSNLRSLDYFSALEDFRQAHEDWRIHHDSDLPGDKLIGKLSSLVDMLGTKTLVIDVERSFKFEVKLTEDGRIKTAKTDDEIENISSNGTSYIIILSLYIGLINMIRKPESGVQLQFCIDELGRVDTASSGKLIEILDSQNIKMFSALPIESSDLLQHYPNCYMIEAEPKSANRRVYKLYSDDSKTTTQSKLDKVLGEI